MIDHLTWIFKMLYRNNQRDIVIGDVYFEWEYFYNLILKQMMVISKQKFFKLTSFMVALLETLKDVEFLTALDAKKVPQLALSILYGF